jgi:hypothetical protein
MNQLRVAWRRAVDADTDAGGPALADLLAFFGPAANASNWTCDVVEAVGPLADERRQEAETGSIPGTLLMELAAGINDTAGRAFAATWPGDDGPWVALRAFTGGQFVVATRSRALLDDLRVRFGDDDATIASDLGED